MTRAAAAFVLLTATLAPLHAAVPTPPEAPDVIYRHAVHNLSIGHDYARSILQLQYVVSKNPGNRQYHLALGCADADRAASLGYAVLWAKMLTGYRAAYPQAVQEWRAAQRDPKSDNYGDPLPAAPPDLDIETEDDNYPFVMPIPKAEASIKLLVKSAQDEWKRALALSAKPAERAEVEWVQGRGMALLRLLVTNELSGNGGDTPVLKDALTVPDEKLVVAALTAATKDAPINALYWQGLGDALRARDGNSGNASSVYAKAAHAAYGKSLALQPVNAPLWFQMYLVDYDRINSQPDKAMTALQHVIDSDPDNAFTHYLLAGIIFRDTHYKDVHDKNERADQEKALHATYDHSQKIIYDAALAQIEQGNAAFHCSVPAYVSPYPDALSGFGIWRKITNMPTISFTSYNMLRELSRAGGGYSRVCAAQGDAPEAERAARDVIGMGLRLCGDWPAKDDAVTGTIMGTLVGIAIASIGYSDLAKGETEMGNDIAAQQAQAEYDAFKAKAAAYKKIYIANMNTYSVFDYY